MKLIAKVKLNTTPEQAKVLMQTLETANTACNEISKVAWQNQTFGQFSLQKLVYAKVKERFSLSAQVVIHCVSKVADAYKLDKKTPRRFRPRSAIAYDDRILRWYTEKQFVSIWTVAGRMKIEYSCGERQRQLLETQQGESDLVYQKGNWFLFATCNIEEPAPEDFSDVLGVDLGIKNIAVDSDGEIHSGAHLLNLRNPHRKIRQRLQKKDTNSAYRLLKKRKAKERRFATDMNHRIAKELVGKAKRTKRAIALENLKGIRTRTRARKPQRATQSSWAFAQLREFIEYKAKREGVMVLFVDPRNTSRTCPACGSIDKRNRPSQSVFCCVSCNHQGFADLIAANNIRRVAVNLPYAEASLERANCNPPALAGGC